MHWLKDAFASLLQWLKGLLVELLGAVSVLVAVVATLVGGLLLLLALFGGSGSFILSEIDIVAPLVVLGGGNLICLVLNLAILSLRRWHEDLGWLRHLVLRVQAGPALLTVAGALLYVGIAGRH